MIILSYSNGNTVAVLNVLRAFFPLDELLQLPPGQLSPLLQEWVVHLGTLAPFTRVPRLLCRFAGLNITRETVRLLTEAAGALLVAEQTATAVTLAPPADPGPDTDERLQLSADGAMVRLCNGDWVEVKTVAVGVVEQRHTADGSVSTHTTDISYYSRHAPAEEFTRGAVVELHQRGVRCAAEVAGIMDGAPWLQGFLDYHRPNAVRILDLPHAAEHLGELAVGIWGEGPAAREWQQQQVQQLRECGAAPLLAELARLEQVYGALPALLQHGQYLRSRAEQLAYDEFKAAGWPLGSGIVESANKLVVEARLKGAGMGWAVEAINPLLALRNAECNGRWEASWEQLCAAQQAQIRANRAGQRPPAIAAAAQQQPQQEIDAVIVAEVAAILERVAAEIEAERALTGVVNGKPAPNHKWRKSELGKID